MNYKHIYDSIIQTRKRLDRAKIGDGSLEWHHILPKCLGGTNSKMNLVLLTPREHYICHHLLYKLHVGDSKRKMAYAFFKMCQNNPSQKRKITARMFENARIACKNNPIRRTGIPMSEDAKRKLSTKRAGSNNPMYGKVPWNKGLTIKTCTVIEEKGKRSSEYYRIHGHPAKGRKLSQDAKNRISATHKGKSKSVDHRQKLSQAQIVKQKKLSPEHLQKLIDVNRTKVLKEIVCPFCKTKGRGNAMHRWHFNNCKQ